MGSKSEYRRLMVQAPEKIYERLQAAEAVCEVAKLGMTAPSGVHICACRNRNAVASGMEKACWYCTVATAIEAWERLRGGGA